MLAVPPPLQIDLDDGNRGQHAEAGNGPRNDLDDLDLVAQAQAALDLALELAKVVCDAVVLALDVAPHLVDEHARDDPEDGGHYEEDLS